MYERIKLDYKTLEPAIEDRTLNLHYNVHYKNFTDKLNELLTESNYDYNYPAIFLAKNTNIIPIDNINEIMYNLGGYLNHSLYFYNLTDKRKKVPQKLLEEINKTFGSFESFKNLFIQNAKNIKGSGYSFLVVDNNSNLRIINMTNQDTPYYYNFIPIMTIDVWEHSYYLKYTYKREEYLNNVFNIIDWDKVYKLFLQSKSN